MTGTGGGAAGAVGTALRAPFTARALREAAFATAGVASAAAVLAVLAVPALLPAVVYLIESAAGSRRSGDTPAVAPEFLVLFPFTVALLAVLAAPAGRAFGAVHRTLAGRLLGVPMEGPPPRAARGLKVLVADAPGWRAVGYALLKVPLAVPAAYGALCYVFGFANLSYPVWWHLFRNHPPGTRLGPVWALTPLGTIGVRTFAGSFAVAGAGAAMLLVAPWLLRAACALDRAAMHRLLGPGRLAERVRELRASRARAIDDAAAMMRRLERDLHDGAQIRLATLAMQLGMASEKLGAVGPPPDLDQARDLVALAHSNAKDALSELRTLVRGIHPPVLDNGLADALDTLAATAAVPVGLDTDLPVRPAPAIETIAYFCVAELLANAAKHSRAHQVRITVTGRGDRVRLVVADDGVGGADPAGPGLSGLARRLAVVDGVLRVHSPAGGPTRVEVDLPMQV